LRSQKGLEMVQVLTGISILYRWLEVTSDKFPLWYVNVGVTSSIHSQKCCSSCTVLVGITLLMSFKGSCSWMQPRIFCHYSTHSRIGHFYGIFYHRPFLLGMFSWCRPLRRWCNQHCCSIPRISLRLSQGSICQIGTRHWLYISAGLSCCQQQPGRWGSRRWRGWGYALHL